MPQELTYEQWCARALQEGCDCIEQSHPPRPALRSEIPRGALHAYVPIGSEAGRLSFERARREGWTF